MGIQRRCFSCHFCGQGVECYSGEAPCEVLNGWLTVSRWRGSGTVEHYSFCSFSCLKSWVDDQVPRVPEVFLEPFKDDES